MIERVELLISNFNVMNCRRQIPDPVVKCMVWCSTIKSF